jgi:hypothetical protein
VRLLRVCDGSERRRPAFERAARGRASRPARVGLFKGFARCPCAGIARAGERLGARGTASCGPRVARKAATAPTTTAARTRRGTPSTRLSHAVARVAHTASSWSVSRRAPSPAAWSKTLCVGWTPRVDVPAGAAKMFRRGSATASAPMASSRLSMVSAHKEALQAKLAPRSWKSASRGNQGLQVRGPVATAKRDSAAQLELRPRALIVERSLRIRCDSEARAARTSADRPRRASVAGCLRRPLVVPGSRLVSGDWDACLPTAAGTPVMSGNCGLVPEPLDLREPCQSTCARHQTVRQASSRSKRTTRGMAAPGPTAGAATPG